MRDSIRSIALLAILAPMLLPSLALSIWHTGVRVRDARHGLIARGEHEVRYLADASSLALLVGDAETLHRLAASNLTDDDAASAVLFLDGEGHVLAAAGNAREIELAHDCSRRAGCRDGVPRYVFSESVRAGAERSRSGQELGAGTTSPPQPVGTVLLSFDPRRLVGIQQAMLLHSALITALALLIGWIAAEYVSRRLITPMQRLSRVVARIQDGELGARTQPAGTGELRELELGINSMADRVEAASVELNRRVDEATAELSLALIEREQRNRELDLALVRAESAARAKDLFLARMSHELRTPLATVTGYAKLMQQSRSEAQRTDFYRTLEQASRILVATVDDILTFVKLEDGSLRLEQREFDLEACIEDAVVMQAPAAHAKGLDIVCHIGGGLPCCVTGDSLRLSQVLTNLISNAIKFTAAGVVSVRALEEDGATLRLTVSDTGIGIAPESIPQLFRPFVQGDESVTRRFGGSGLGLAITASLVQALGGRVELQSTPGEGTCVTVWLPLLLPGRSAPVPPPLPRLHVALVWPAASPHRAVLRDYLGGCFALQEFDDAPQLQQSLRDRADEPPGLYVLGEGVDERELPSDVPVVRLRGIEVIADPGQRYCQDVVPLPARRRDLLAACLRRSGHPERVGENCCRDSARDETRALAARCVVVEDNALNRRMIAAQLRALGVRVVEASGGEQALALLAHRQPDLVLADVHMPGMDGVTLAMHLRDRHPAVPVYALTANVIGSEEAALAASGVRAVLYKPLDPERLLDVLASHGRPGPPWRVLARPGIAEGEVEREIARLFDALGRAWEAGTTDAADLAHQLLGVARAFTRGELEDCCLDVEHALRGADGERARQEIENLAILVRAERTAAGELE